jgi:Na+/H+-dicarboxylate symporter
MIYCTFATLFIAQAYGIHMPISTQITMMLVLMLTSKGIAGVPRASLVVIAATLHQFNIPEAGLLVILASIPSSTWAVRPPTQWATRSLRPWWPSGKAAC